jgi:hypothetical protein
MRPANNDSFKKNDQKLEHYHTLLNFAAVRALNLPILKLEEIELFIKHCKSVTNNLSIRQERILETIESMWKKQINMHVKPFTIQRPLPDNNDHTYRLTPRDIKLLQCIRIDPGVNLFDSSLTNDDKRFLRMRRIKPD